jgi:hypothetical protein
MFGTAYYYIAMACTLVGWAAQFYTTIIKKHNNLNLLLPLFYGLACIFFVIDTITARNLFDTIFNLVTAILVLSVFIVFIARKKR